MENDIYLEIVKQAEDTLGRELTELEKFAMLGALIKPVLNWGGKIGAAWAKGMATKGVGTAMRGAVNAGVTKPVTNWAGAMNTSWKDGKLANIGNIKNMAGTAGVGFRANPYLTTGVTAGAVGIPAVSAVKSVTNAKPSTGTDSYQNMKAQYASEVIDLYKEAFGEEAWNDLVKEAFGEAEKDYNQDFKDSAIKTGLGLGAGLGLGLALRGKFKEVAKNERVTTEATEYMRGIGKHLSESNVELKGVVKGQRESLFPEPYHKQILNDYRSIVRDTNDAIREDGFFEVPSIDGHKILSGYHAKVDEAVANAELTEAQGHYIKNMLSSNIRIKKER